MPFSSAPPPIPGIPSERGLPVLGSLIPFARDPLAFLSHLQRTHGDMAQFRLMEHRIVQISHPKLVEEVLLGAARSMHKDAIYEVLRPLLGNGLVTSEDPEWRRNRKLAAPSFSRRHVEIYADAMVACARRWCEAVDDGEERDLHGDMMDITQRIVLQTLFGTDLAVDVQIVGDSIDTVMHEFVYEVQRGRRLLPAFVRTPGRRRSDRAIAALDAQVGALVAARREAGLGDDLLSRLLAARDDEGRGFDDRQLRDEAVTMFVAGHETTALALTFTLLLLANHPDVEDRLRAEVDEVLGGGAAVASDMARLPYATAVIKESMRLMPPVWAIGREAMEDVTIGGHTIPAGTQLLVAQWVQHRDPRWFDAPLDFLPERWLDGSTTGGASRLEQRLPRMAYLPFGGGPRICIGNHFAMLEAVLVLATLTQHVRVRPYGPVPPPLVPSITLRPAGPVPAWVRRRASALPARRSVAEAVG